MTGLTMREVIAALDELPDHVREKVLDYDLATEGCDCFGEVAAIEVEHWSDGGGTITLLRQGDAPEILQNSNIIAAKLELPYQQFPYGVWVRQKPIWWDEYRDLRERGLFPTGHEDL